MNKLFAIVTCICLVFAFAACGGSESTSGFDVPFETGTTDAVQITTNAGDVQEITAKELDELQDENGARFDSDYKLGEVIGVGVVSKIDGSGGWNGYDMEASIRLENGWFIEAASTDDVKDFNIGDVIAFKGKLSGVWNETAMVFGKDEKAPQLQLFAVASEVDETKDDKKDLNDSAEYYEENAKLPKIDSVVKSISETGSSTSYSSGTAGTSFTVEYTYSIDAPDMDSAIDLLKEYYDYASENGLKAQEEDEDTYKIMDGDSTLATISFEAEDGSYYAELEILEIDKSYEEKKIEEMNDESDN